MGSPARRRRFVTRSAASLPDATTTVVTLDRPDSPGAIAGGTSYSKDLLNAPDPNDPGDLSGKASLAIRGAIAVATVTLRKLALVDADGNDLFVVWEDAAGIPANDTALLPDILASLPVSNDEFLALSLNNASGGLLAGNVDGVYDLGINFGQEGA